MRPEQGRVGCPDSSKEAGARASALEVLSSVWNGKRLAPTLGICVWLDRTGRHQPDGIGRAGVTAPATKIAFAPGRGAAGGICRADSLALPAPDTRGCPAQLLQAALCKDREYDAERAQAPAYRAVQEYREDHEHGGDQHAGGEGTRKEIVYSREREQIDRVHGCTYRSDKDAEADGFEELCFPGSDFRARKGICELLDRADGAQVTAEHPAEQQG